jgi:hypothetical protein
MLGKFNSHGNRQAIKRIIPSYFLGKYFNTGHKRTFIGTRYLIPTLRLFTDREAGARFNSLVHRVQRQFNFITFMKLRLSR